MLWACATDGFPTINIEIYQLIMIFDELFTLQSPTVEIMAHTFIGRGGWYHTSSAMDCHSWNHIFNYSSTFYCLSSKLVRNTETFPYSRLFLRTVNERSHWVSTTLLWLPANTADYSVLIFYYAITNFFCIKVNSFEKL